MSRAGKHPCDVQTVACGVCAVQKKETNHWFVLVGKKDEFRCLEFTVEVWLAAKISADDPEHSGVIAIAVACGEEHNQELFSRWLVARTFLPPSARPVSAPRSSTQSNEEEKQND